MLAGLITRGGRSYYVLSRERQGESGSLIQRIPNQHAETDNRRLPTQSTCDVSMAVLLCRDLEVELAVPRLNPAGLG